MIAQPEIDKLISDIVEGYNPEKIYLFGSYVNGTQNEDSEIDLLVVKPTSLRREDRMEQILNSLKNYPNIGVDFIIYTPEELESVKNDVVNIAKEAINTGKLLYERV